MTKIAPSTISITPLATAEDASHANTRAALAAALCGMGLLWIVGFSEIEVLHNIAHDTRHSHLFPCH